MPRETQRHRSTIYPFRYRDEGLQFDVEHYSMNGGGVEALDLPAGQNTIDVDPESPSKTSLADEPWERVTVFGSVEVSGDVLDYLFPPDEQDAPPAKLYVAIRCHDTIYRDSEIIEDPLTEPGEYEVTIRLDWDDFRGRVELRPYLVRTTDRTGDDQYASTRNTKVASGDRYEVVVDRWVDDSPPMIDGEEARFSKSDHLPEGEKLYYLDFRDETRPKLWINADHPRIADVLRSEGSVGAEPRLRDVVLDQISYGVWSQLILRAAGAITRSGDVEYEWQETVLEAFALDLYDVDDIEDAKQLLREDVRDPEELGHLASQIDTELQEFIEPRSQLINLMEEGLRI
ncbi:hypothetical protein Hrd1104_00160 [Halorhabdus sp. CBA1104]|uniref:hypothetical protein n=1 Tax=Halorhabdus sp. CBA1104 TaxID=1380432 RepID=UPI0012B29DC3|nr:hypothetical protein [Halorhabdus sp. CBA1104]QGN05857.1 hypothetical protein Hrd1104_00160 [Halorhabdus sp. CBA1104]